MFKRRKKADALLKKVHLYLKCVCVSVCVEEKRLKHYFFVISWLVYVNAPRKAKIYGPEAENKFLKTLSELQNDFIGHLMTGFNSN